MSVSGKLVRNVLTAAHADAPQKTTVLTIDFDGVTEEQSRNFMARSITIDVQRTWRKNGIPATATVRVADLVAGHKQSEPVTLETEKARAALLSADDLRKLVEQLKAQIK